MAKLISKKPAKIQVVDIIIPGRPEVCRWSDGEVLRVTGTRNGIMIARINPYIMHQDIPGWEQGIK